MTQIVCVTGTHNVGITFLDWSLHWLSGHNSVYHWQHGWQPITTNPLTGLNAHAHYKNHLSGIAATQSALTQLYSVDTTWHSIYPVGPAVDQRARDLGYTADVVHNDTAWQHIIDLCDQEYAEVWNYCAQQNCERVFVATTVNNAVYHAHTLDRAQHAVMFADQPQSDTFLRMHELFFAQSLATVSTTWDRRELLALNLQLHRARLGHEHLDFTKPHHWINCHELWYHAHQLVPVLMNQLAIPLQWDRWDHWQTVYQNWQQINYRCVKFQYELDHIVEAIVNNWSYPLLELSFLQEVMIQHELLYKHGLNIKNWQLERFPDNTQKLHQLLEINHHQFRSTT